MRIRCICSAVAASATVPETARRPQAEAARPEWSASSPGLLLAAASTRYSFALSLLPPPPSSPCHNLAAAALVWQL
eukprot:SM005011S17813  [mRNA]  locus=s5011:35:357:- [translate_table: standard]